MPLVRLVVNARPSSQKESWGGEDDRHTAPKKTVVLGEEEWMRRMAKEDFRTLTPLLHSHVNPYGSFELDMEKRLPLDQPVAMAV